MLRGEHTNSPSLDSYFAIGLPAFNYTQILKPKEETHMLSNVYMIYTHKYIYIHYKVHVIQRNFLERKTSHQQETLLTACFPLRSPASIAGSSVGVNALPGNSKNHRRWATTTTKCQSTSQLLPSKIMERHNKTHGKSVFSIFQCQKSTRSWILLGLNIKR